jgi:hypothetical protein
MAVKHVAWAHDLEWDFDSPTQRYVFLEMVYWSDRKGVVRMSQAEMGERLSLSRQTVSREFGRLQDIGLIVRLEHGRYGIRFQNGDTPRPQKDSRRPSERDDCFWCGGIFVGQDYSVQFTDDGDAFFMHPRCIGESEAAKTAAS